MTASKKCPLCQQWHNIDYREDCYDHVASRIRKLENEIKKLQEQITQPKKKTK